MRAAEVIRVVGSSEVVGSAWGWVALEKGDVAYLNSFLNEQRTDERPYGWVGQVFSSTEAWREIKKLEACRFEETPVLDSLQKVDQPSLPQWGFSTSRIMLDEVMRRFLRKDATFGELKQAWSDYLG